MISLVLRYYPGIAIVMEISLGTVVCCLLGLVLCGYCKLQSWKKPNGLVVMNLLAADLVNGMIAPLQAAYIHCLLNEIKAAELFRTIFFFQSLFLWVSLLIMNLLSISRLIAILVPLRYTSIVNLRTTGILLTAFWVTGITNSLLKRYVTNYNHFQYFVAGLLFHLILNVVILGLAFFSILVLNVYGERSQSRIRATKTVIVVSLSYFVSYSYYIYVNIVWMIPNLPYHTTNEWIIFTAVGKWSLSLAHLFLLINSLFNGVIFGLQPKIKEAIKDIWVPDYYRYSLLREAREARSSGTQ